MTLTPSAPGGAPLTGGLAAGDIHHGSVRRVASAVGDGAMAVSLIHRFLASDQAPPA